MTRDECEAKILNKMKEILMIYHEYNPDGNYITAFMLDKEHKNSWCLAFYNHHYDKECVDFYKPIDKYAYVNIREDGIYEEK